WQRFGKDHLPGRPCLRDSHSVPRLCVEAIEHMALTSTPLTTRRTAAAGGWAVVVVGLTVAVGMWWQDTPTGSLHTWSARLIAMGQLTALTGTWMLLVTVLLMARLPWIEGVIGLDHLTTWHGRCGEYAIALLVAHV